MTRKILILALVATVVGELLFAGAVLFAPELALEQAKIAVTPDILFLAYGLSWTILVIGLVCGYALKLVLENQHSGHVLTRILGFWWIAVGAAVYMKWGRPEILVLDSLKGLILVIASYATTRRRA